MTTQYIDPQIIFASDAPTQDKPPAFNNYIKGMDETRSNDGRPTIKQLNFIQQQNDFKFLYMHERGACLPFVEGFPYENNAIVFKDGLIQQKSGASWIIPFMRGSQNLAELKDVAQARIKLDVYSKSEALSKENNLLDVSDKGVARTNLGVYSKAETDAIAGTPNATEAVAGKAKIATTAIAQAGVNDTDFITPKKLLEFIKSNVIKNDFVDVTSSRVRDVTYTNPSTASYLNIRINATITGSGGRVSIFVNDKIEVKSTTSGGAGWGETIFLLVPPMGTYRLEGSSTLTYWSEA